MAHSQFIALFICLDNQYMLLAINVLIMVNQRFSCENKEKRRKILNQCLK